jgi:hypothetical protein
MQAAELDERQSLDDVHGTLHYVIEQSDCQSRNVIDGIHHKVRAHLFNPRFPTQLNLRL